MFVFAVLIIIGVTLTLIPHVAVSARHGKDYKKPIAQQRGTRSIQTHPSSPTTTSYSMDEKVRP